MHAFLPYIACLTLALAVYAALRPTAPAVRIFMIVAGVAAAGWLIGIVVGSLSSFGNVSQGIFFFIFSLSCVGAAIRMVTHERPVYSALYFVIVVIATAGLLLLLEAEFIAFALIIVYAGAILITYMFVLMLANQATDEDHSSTQAVYDRIPKEPAVAVGVGFLILCLMTGSVMSGVSNLPEPLDFKAQWLTLESLPKQFERSVIKLDATFTWPPASMDDGTMIRHDDQGAYVISIDNSTLYLPTSMLPTNTQHVGWALVNDFPVSLELAGVILLMAMYGAAVLARRAIELGEREKRAALLGHDATTNVEGGSD